jgi:hypothetical protein
MIEDRRKLRTMITGTEMSEQRWFYEESKKEKEEKKHAMKGNDLKITDP